MKVAAPRESRPGERRVALVPETVQRLVAAGFTVAVEPGAGADAFVTDDAYVAAGATVAPDALRGADAVLSVDALPAQRYAELGTGALAISFVPLPQRRDAVAAAAAAGVTLCALERLPRISRAQSMDALTSQALVAGYRAVLVAADRSPRFFPLLMTAAGTVQPARVLVLGAGVAGLQAMATAKRLGARVSAYDVRPSSADEVRSMGATFLDLGLESLAGTGGYAREMTAERAAAQQDALAPHVADADVLITTAAVPNRPAPRLVTAAMLSAMRPGSVVVDLAAESGGNVEGSVPGEEVDHDGVRLVGARDVPSDLADHASRLYARNVCDLLLLCVADGDAAGELRPDLGDEILDAVALTAGGAVRHDEVAALLAEGADA